MFIRWGNTYSTKFLVTNGVKQGGILSPFLFNVYMNNLSLSLNSSSIGGSLGDNVINHLCYPDDLCPISLSSSGMQHLLDICDTLGQNGMLDISFILNMFEMSWKTKTWQHTEKCHRKLIIFFSKITC